MNKDDHISDDFQAEPLNEHEQEGMGEAWQGNEPPPVDDFGDPAGTGEDAATASAESEPGMDEDAAPTTEEGTEKKRSLLLPAAAGIGGILLLGGLLYWQFGGALRGPSLPPVAAHATPSFPQKSPAAQPATPMAKVGGAAPAADAAAADAATTQTVAASVGGSIQPGVAMPGALGDQASLSVPPADAPATSGADLTPSAPGLSPLPSAEAAAPVAVPSPSAPVLSTPNVTASAADASVSARLSSLTGKVESLQKMLDQTTQQLSQLHEKLATSETGAAAALQAQAIEDRLSKIEQQVSQKSVTHSPALTSPVSMVPDIRLSSEENEAAVKTEPENVKAPAKHSAAKMTKPKNTKKKAHNAVGAAKKKAVAARWVLRAATPQEAWVAASESSKELRPVKVGDELPGIGRVLAIRQSGNAWSVVGSNGAIR